MAHSAVVTADNLHDKHPICHTAFSNAASLSAGWWNSGLQARGGASTLPA